MFFAGLIMFRALFAFLNHVIKIFVVNISETFLLR